MSSTGAGWDVPDWAAGFADADGASSGPLRPQAERDAVANIKAVNRVAAVLVIGVPKLAFQPVIGDFSTKG